MKFSQNKVEIIKIFKFSIMIPLLAHYVQIEFADNVLLIFIICANKYTICAGIIADNVQK